VGRSGGSPIVRTVPAGLRRRGGERGRGGRWNIFAPDGSPQTAAAGRVTDSGAEFAVAASGRAEAAIAEPGIPESGAVQDQGLPQGVGRKIVKTADLGLRAEKVRAASAEAQRVAARLGGSVLSSETYRADGSVSADMLPSVPSSVFSRLRSTSCVDSARRSLPTASGERT
jgi:hypothetical protein